MMLTTRGRYAVMAMVDIASQAGDKPVSLAQVAERQEIALTYLEQLFVLLKKADLVRSVRGPGGGYRLAKDAKDINIWQVIEAAEESMQMTRCKGGSCMRNASLCKTHHLWDGLSKRIEAYFASVSLLDIDQGKKFVM